MRDDGAGKGQSVTRSELIAGLTDLLLETSPGLDQESITEDVSFEDLGLDSLDRINFLLAIQENLGHKISDEDAERLTSLEAMADHLLGTG